MIRARACEGTALVQPEANAILMDLYTLSLSNALAGYVYRTVEEMMFERRTAPLSNRASGIFSSRILSTIESAVSVRVLAPEQEVFENRHHQDQDCGEPETPAN